MRLLRGTSQKRISAEQGSATMKRCWVSNDNDLVCIPLNRNQLKANYEMSYEIQGTLVEDIAMQVCYYVCIHELVNNCTCRRSRYTIIFLCLCTSDCITLSLKIWSNNLEFCPIIGGNLQHSRRVYVLFPFIAHTHDNLCRKLETMFHHSVKGTK